MSSSARELVQAANNKEQTAKTRGFTSFFGGGSSAKLEEARELYNKAANQFKGDKNFKESGDAFIRAGECALKSDEKYDAAMDFWNAGKSYKQTHPELAVGALERTVDLYKEQGRFRQAADRKKDIAQILQQSSNNLEAAMDAWEQAGDWYATDDAQATASACFREVADIAAELGYYEKAVTKYEEVAQSSLGSQLTRYSVKEYFFKAGLCHLCRGDLVVTRRALEHYESMDATFNGTRECKFLKAITEALENGDMDAFTQEVVNFDSVTKLDNWKTNMLLKVRNQVKDEPGLT